MITCLNNFIIHESFPQFKYIFYKNGKNPFHILPDDPPGWYYYAKAEQMQNKKLYAQLHGTRKTLKLNSNTAIQVLIAYSAMYKMYFCTLFVVFTSIKRLKVLPIKLQ